MTESNYHNDTSKYMVTERGRMPYDSRLTEETRVRDDYVPKKEQIQFVEIYPMPTDEKSTSFELDRLDHEWQQNWFRENGDLNIRIKTRKGDDSTNAIILSQIRKYRNDLGDFHRNDETYKLALEEFRRKNTELNELFHKRNAIRKALENKTLRSISLDDAIKLGWIIENDPKYTIHRSSKHSGQYVYANEYKEKWTGEKVPLTNETIWLSETTIIDEKKGGKLRKSRKMKKTHKSHKSHKSRKMKKTKKSKKSSNAKRNRK
jgi:hypothetical protein